MKDLPSAHGVLSAEQRHELQAIIGPCPTVPWAAGVWNPLDGPPPPLAQGVRTAATSTSTIAIREPSRFSGSQT
jgi:hypothetical protein